MKAYSTVYLPTDNPGILYLPETSELAALAVPIMRTVTPVIVSPFLLFVIDPINFPLPCAKTAVAITNKISVATNFLSVNCGFNLFVFLFLQIYYHDITCTLP
ncbi:hypothetical protein D3C87_1442930 [compost metagenome]